MNLLQQFQQYISDERLFSGQDRLLLAVSGGVDSVVLCELCTQAGYKFTIGHCNFQLRGTESERDEQFVKALAAKYRTAVVVKQFDTLQYASNNKVSIQVAARELRYEWFYSLVKELQLSKLVTAHHLDDNIETMLMNFFKGTGISGLRGMLPRQEILVRPLLFAKKEELLSFAKEQQLSWVEDSSNQSDKYTRNYFRNQLIPLLQTIYPGVENNLADNLYRFKDIEQLYYQAITLQTKKLLEYRNNEVLIPVLKLKKASPLSSIVFEIIKQYNFSASQTQEVISLLESETGKYIQGSTHRVIKNRNWLIISPNQLDLAAHILIDRETSQVDFENGSILLKECADNKIDFPAGNSSAYLNMKAIKFPLLLRKYKSGDYFYPLGMKKKKKLSRFFIDQKLSKSDKEKVWVLESNKKIVWVTGYRIDDRFKIEESTTQVLKIELRLKK